MINPELIKITQSEPDEFGVIHFKAELTVTASGNISEPEFRVYPRDRLETDFKEHLKRVIWKQIYGSFDDELRGIVKVIHGWRPDPIISGECRSAIMSKLLSLAKYPR